MKESQEENHLLALEAKYCSYGDTVHYAKNPKLFTACEGSYVFDASRIPFLDLNMQNAAASLGYKHPRLVSALKNQLDALPQLASQFLHKEKILLAKGICEKAERAFGRAGRVHFNVGGAQAIEDALKLIRRNTENPLMFAFMGGYHGRTLGASAVTSSFRYREGLSPFPHRALFVPYPYCFRCYYEKKLEDCGFYCLRMFEKLFESEYYGAYNPKTKRSEFAAFFAEPVQGTGGYIVPPKDYFLELDRILKARGVLFLDDEVQMGFMRTGRLFAMEHFGARPDIVTFSKALTGGLNPLSGLWADEALIGPERFGPGSTHSTFSSNTLGTVLGLEVLKIFEENPAFGDQVLAKGRKFLDGLKTITRPYKMVGNVDGLGLALRLEICQEDGFTPNYPMTQSLFDKGLEARLEAKGKRYGLVLAVGGYFKNVITLIPSLLIEDSEVDLALTLLEQLFKTCEMR